MVLTLDPADRKFWPKTAEPGFSVRKNRWIIKDAMRKHDLNVKRKNAEFTDKMEERSHAVVSYLRGMEGLQRGRSIEQYFGKIGIAYLRGEKIKNKLVAQQKMLLNSKKELYEQEQARELISKSVVKQIRRTDAKKEQKSSKKV